MSQLYEGDEEEEVVAGNHSGETYSTIQPNGEDDEYYK